MKYYIFASLFLIFAQAHALEQELIESKIEGIAEILIQEGGEIEQLKSLNNQEAKVIKFNQIVTSVAGANFSKEWNHPTKDSWLLVDWDHVTTLDTFFKDQFSWLSESASIANNEDEMAKNGIVSWLINSEAGLGEIWFEKWYLMASDIESPRNLRLLIYWFTEDFGEDLAISDVDAGTRNVDWGLWQETYNRTDELGKAIILKNITMIASRADGWDEAALVHMLALNSNNDALKAIAIVKGDINLGNEVVDKWRDILKNSTNEKLKVLAQEALDLRIEN